MDRIRASNEHQETEEIREKAKISVLIIVQKFAEADIFEKEECDLFLENYLNEIKNEMGFKIKRFLLPALISVSKQLDYNDFIENVYNLFKVFSADEVWGVRKACIEHMDKLVQHLHHDDEEKLEECLNFFKKCLTDSNRWVKNQALVQFGPIVHKIYLKYEPEAPKEGEKASQPISDEHKTKLKTLVKDYLLAYYDTKLIFGDTTDDKDILEESLVDKIDGYSFAQNKADDVDKVRYYWAFNMPCAILVCGKDNAQFWNDNLKTIYDMLHKDILLNVRTAMAAGFKEIIKLLDIQKMENETEKQYFITILNHYLKDTEEAIC